MSNILDKLKEKESLTTIKNEQKKVEIKQTFNEINDTNEEKNYEEVLDDLNDAYGDKDCTFDDVETIAKTVFGTLPIINYSSIRKEIDEMHVDTYPAPTTFQINEGLYKVQGYKERLSEITDIVEHEYSVRKRAVEMLFEANQAVSKQSSADKRKGEATIRYPILLLKLESITAFKQEISNCMNNIRSAGDTISRQASVISMQIALGEYRKKMPGEFKQGNNAEENMDYKSGAPDVLWNENDFE